ncbi:MAG: hypothetical protein AAF125_15520 [Chloroflexota bacterium]
MSIALDVERRVLLWPASCTDVAWDIQNIQQIYFNDDATVGMGETTVCSPGFTGYHPTAHFLIDVGEATTGDVVAPIIVPASMPWLYYSFVTLIMLTVGVSLPGKWWAAWRDRAARYLTLPDLDRAWTSPETGKNLALALMMTLFAFLWYNNAWISDDAMITMRSVRNLVEGNGIIWNPNERVQTFTHPLWFFVLSAAYFITRNLFYTTLAVGLVLSATAIYTVGRAARTTLALAVVPLLLLSQAFVDYTSSGLENSLSYLLMVLIFLRYLDEKYDTALFTLMALAFLTRMDYAVLLLPAALMAWWRIGFRVRPLLIPVGMVIAWFAFSTFYFGFPLPNTFLAKMATDYPTYQYADRFWAYVMASIEIDPMTLALIATGVVLPIAARSRAWVISLGLAMYMAYVWRIGGDFMVGRYFAVPAICAALALVVVFNTARVPVQARQWTLLALFSLGLFVGSPFDTRRENDANHRINPERAFVVTDEQGYYFQRSSLSNWHTRIPERDLTDEDLSGVILPRCSVGRHGLEDQDVYVLDFCALGSAYLARVPAIQTPDRYIGHSRRHMPLGLQDWISGESGTLADPELERYFNDIRLVISGPLFSEERMRAIWRVNFGEYDYNRLPFITDF